MEINKFDREETLRRFIRKQNWPEFSNDDPNNKNNKTQSQQEMMTEESQPIDNYLNDPNWKLTSNNRLKRNSISKSNIMNFSKNDDHDNDHHHSKHDKYKSTDGNNDGMSLYNDSNKSLQTSKQSSSSSSVSTSRTKTAISSSKSKSTISTSSLVAVTYKEPVIEIKNKNTKLNFNKQSRKRMIVPLKSDNEKNKLRRIHVEDDDDDDVNDDNFDDKDDDNNDFNNNDDDDEVVDDNNIFDDYNNDDHDVDNDDRNSEHSHQHKAVFRISKQQQHQVFIDHHCSLFLLF